MSGQIHKTARKPFRLALAQAMFRNLPPLFAPRLRGYVYPYRRALRDNYSFSALSHGGTWLEGNTSDPHAYSFSVTGYYDWRNIAVAAAVCQEGDTIIEVGANVGTETVCFAALLGSRGKVIAFEPAPSNIDALRKTMALNSNLNITLFPNAVGEACKRLRFCAFKSRENSGLGHIATSGDAESAEHIEVECVTLDSMSEMMGAARLLAVDVEGLEDSVLKGARRYIQENRPVIILEAVPMHQKRAGSTLRHLHATLVSFGYKVRTIGTIRLGEADLSDSAKATNWLCVHREQSDLFRHIADVMRRVAFFPCIRGLNPICGGSLDA